MSEATKMDLPARKVAQIDDAKDLVEMLFPGNSNQQYAAACILFELKWADAPVPSLSPLEARYPISRRTLQRTRAKLARLGLIEHISSLNLCLFFRCQWQGHDGPDGGREVAPCRSAVGGLLRDVRGQARP